ncbi:MAG: hypothetical protein CVU47_04935 [Chloroflexi bacterium HGW-Chloroflexi-9]|nr:MAG: hypothetical protein CVU47_04935 [Chloroflexi bacterium HGW-Chloroflexi-9]
MAAVRTVLTLVAVIVSAIGFAACRGGGGEATPTPPAPTATASASPSPATLQPTETPSAALEDEVAEAYLAYWDAYADAVLNLDITYMDGFAVGEDLESIRQDIERLRSEGSAARIEIVHDFVVAAATSTSAVVIDHVVNESYLVDPVTKATIAGGGTGETLRYTFHLERIEDRWVVTRATREASD